jgi:hypothetical protein
MYLKASPSPSGGGVMGYCIGLYFLKSPFGDWGLFLFSLTNIEIYFCVMKLKY